MRYTKDEPFNFMAVNQTLRQPRFGRVTLLGPANDRGMSVLGYHSTSHQRKLAIRPRIVQIVRAAHPSLYGHMEVDILMATKSAMGIR